MSVIDQIQGGNFQTASGTPIAGGKITFQLSGPAKTINDGQAVLTPITLTLDGTGSVAASTPLYGNDQLTPSTTFYIVSIYDSSGTLVRGPEHWVIAGASPIDLGTITPS